MASGARPEGELRAGPLTLKRYRGTETGPLLAAVRASIVHLRPWMPWAAEDPTPESIGEFVGRAADDWSAGGDFGYWMQENASGELVGGAGLHRRVGPGGLEIGYWVHVDWTRHGFATETARALTAAALALPDVRRVEIHCDEANTPSAGVPTRLGYRLDRTVPDEVKAPGEVGRSMIWVMERK